MNTSKHHDQRSGKSSALALIAVAIAVGIAVFVGWNRRAGEDTPTEDEQAGLTPVTAYAGDLPTPVSYTHLTLPTKA